MKDYEKPSLERIPVSKTDIITADALSDCPNTEKAYKLGSFPLKPSLLTMVSIFRRT